MDKKKIAIIAGLAAVGLLAFAGTASAAVAQPKPGEDGGDTEGEGEDPIVLPPPPPPPSTGFGPPPNSGNQGMLDGYFGNAAGIARALYLLGFGTSSAQMASELDVQAKDADKDDDLAFVREFQVAYNRLAAAGRAGKGDVAFGTIPADLGELAQDGTMGYRTLGALYNTLRHFSPGDVWNLTTGRVQGTSPIATGERADLRGYLNNL